MVSDCGNDSSTGALIEALRRTVILDPKELPCQHAQQPPCRNLGLYVFAGLKLCIAHFNDATR